MKEDQEKLICRKIKCEHLVQDRWIDFRKCTYELPDGTESGPYYQFTRRDYAVIVARDDEGRFLCVRQFRPGLEAVTTEFVAGGLEPADGKKHLAGDADAVPEDALEAAVRELREETGYVADSWQKLISIPSYATMSDNDAHLFFADKCRKVSEQSLDEEEFLSVVKYSGEELEQLIREGGFQQSVHMLAWFLAKEYMRAAGEEW